MLAHLVLHHRPIASSFLVFACALALARRPAAQVGTVESEQKIGEAAGGFGGDLDASDGFGGAIASLGDLDGDWIEDIAVGTHGDDDGGDAQGAVWILFLDTDGTVRSEQKISATAGGFGGNLDPHDVFGAAVVSLGDLDGDGITDIAVGASGDDDGAFAENRGAVWILFLNADGTVKSVQKISATAGGFGGPLDPSDFFGGALASLGDVDGDGIGDLAVGAKLDDDGGDAQGAVWILFLDTDGSVKSERKISETQGGFGGNLAPGDQFGCSIAPLGDLDGDGIGDLSVGAELDNDGNGGAVWILFLNADSTVESEQKISDLAGGFSGTLGFLPLFGASLAALGDLDRDGNPDLAVGAFADNGGGHREGAVFILFLNPDGTVRSDAKISEADGGFTGDIDDFDYFGWSVAAPGDLDGDAVGELVVGEYRDSDVASAQGSVWVIFLEGAEPCITLDFQTEDDLVTPLVNGQHIDTEFGTRVTITSAGANAGAGIFDSTPGGPNDPSQDPDLLVNTGNLLILQTENYPPDSNDVFPRPNDDEDGGTLSFAFPVPIEPRSLRMVDIDMSDGTSLVVLSDASGRLRTYNVPRNWTGDRMLSQPGHGTLDLATLAPQPGFGSIATATQDAFFNPEAVVRIDVHLTGSSAVDELVWCSFGEAERSPRARMRRGGQPPMPPGR